MKSSNRTNYDLIGDTSKAVIDDDFPRIRYASDSDFRDDSGDEDDDDDFYDSSKGRKVRICEERSDEPRPRYLSE